MAGQKGRWTTMRTMFCCFVVKDAVPDSPQPQSCNASENSDPESIPDQPLQSSPSQVQSRVRNLSRWEDREVMYQKCIQDLEQELKKALKTNKALSGQLYEMGCLAFPEMKPCDATSPSFAEKLKVYLESLQFERRQLERRALRAEETVWEIENEVAVLETRLHGSGYRGLHRIDRSLMPGGPPTQPMRYFFSKIHKKSPEKVMAVRSPRKRAEESFGEVVSAKQSTAKEVRSSVPWAVPPRSGHVEVKSCAPCWKRDIFPEHRLPQTTYHSTAGSYRPPPERSGSSSSREGFGHGHICVAQVHGHWDAHEGREQGELAKGAEDDRLSTTSTLPGTTTLLGRGGEDIKMHIHSSVNPALQVSEPKHLASQPMEGNCESERRGGGITSKKEECDPLKSVCPKPMGLAGQVFEDLGHTQADLRKQDDDLGEKTFQDPPGQAASMTEIDLPGKDSLVFGNTQNINMMHGSDQATDLEPRPSQALLAEQVPCSLQKPEECTPLKSSLQADLPLSSIKSLDIDYALVDEPAVEHAPELANAADRPIPMEDDPSVALPLHPKPGELLVPGPSEALTSSYLESTQPASFMEEGTSSPAEETAPEEHKSQSCSSVHWGD